MAHAKISQDAVDEETGAANGAWDIVLEAARRAEQLALDDQSAAFTINHDASVSRVPLDDPAAELIWDPAAGWNLALAQDDPRRALLELYLPICGATRQRPIMVGHLGQSVDGFIATHSGDSQFVTGQANIVHLHRMRALSDAIVVGAGTVAADDPQLTTRHVAGPSPLRVVLDPMRRLAEHYKVFRDHEAETLYVCGRSLVGPHDSHFGRAKLVAVADTPNGMDVTEVAQLLHARGCHRIFVEGGGVTVSMFLEANLLDRLQVAIAPLIIGNGRPAIRLPARTALSDCPRPAYRVFRMGGDMFFDFDLRTSAEGSGPELDEGPPAITRVL